MIVLKKIINITIIIIIIFVVVVVIGRSLVNVQGLYIFTA